MCGFRCTYVTNFYDVDLRPPTRCMPLRKKILEKFKCGFNFLQRIFTTFTINTFFMTHKLCDFPNTQV